MVAHVGVTSCDADIECIDQVVPFFIGQAWIEHPAFSIGQVFAPWTHFESEGALLADIEVQPAKAIAIPNASIVSSVFIEPTLVPIIFQHSPTVAEDFTEIELTSFASSRQAQT